MKKAILVMGLGLFLAGCASEENTGYGSAPAPERGGGDMNDAADVPAAGDTTQLKSMARVPPSATNTTDGTTSNAEAGGKGAFEDQNLDGVPSPSGTGAQIPEVNSNRVGNTSARPVAERL